jgi:hypothetical protein
MLIQYLLESYIPNNIIHPISDNILSLPHEFFRSYNLFADSLEHAGHYRPPLWPVLFQIQCYVVVVQIIVEGLDTTQQAGGDVYDDVCTWEKGLDGELDGELVPEMLELLLVDVFV